MDIKEEVSEESSFPDFCSENERDIFIKDLGKQVKIETVKGSNDIKPELEDSTCSQNEEHNLLRFTETIKKSEIETKIDIMEEEWLLEREELFIRDDIKSASSKNPAAKLLQQPSISIMPLPRQPTGMAPGNPANSKYGQHPGGKATFVICEICDVYIKDLEQLRNHMQRIHKVKIHPKMIYNRPTLNCQNCQLQFFTDQGLERHLLGSHGIVSCTMQKAANKGKDGGRCPICGKVYRWKLLSHVARDHMRLKTAHLLYKCTMCTARFGMYKQFENHVYSAHRFAAKRVMDKKSPQVPHPPQNDTLLKPLKINDEITIIPQPAKPRHGPASRTGATPAWKQDKDPPSKVHSCENCDATFDGPPSFQLYVGHVKRQHLHHCKNTEILNYVEDYKEGVDVIEPSDDEMVIGQGCNEITITKVSCAPSPKRFKQRLQQQRDNILVIEVLDSTLQNKGPEDGAGRENGEDSLTAIKERLRRNETTITMLS